MIVGLKMKHTMNVTAETSFPVNEILYVCNIHLEGHPSLSHTRVSQIKSLLTSLSSRFNKFHSTHLSHPNSTSSVIIAGDFNSNNESGVHQLLSTGRLEAGSKDPIYGSILVPGEIDLTHTLKLKHVHEAEQVEALATFLYKTDQSESTEVMGSDVIDFIFYTYNTLVVEKVMQGVSAEELEQAIQTGGIPNLWNSSDHFPTGCVFKLKKADNKEEKYKEQEQDQEEKKTEVKEK